jgi:hypothetical protein
MFATPLIDTFNRTESPLSDSGNWTSLLYPSSDFIDATTFVGGSFIDHHSFGFGGVMVYSVRTGSPGSSTAQEASFGSNATYSSLANNALSVLLRFDNSTRNGYEFKFRDAGSGAHCDIYLWAAGVTTLLAAGDQAGVSTGDMSVGARAIGTALSAYAMNVGGSGGWQPVVNTSDATYTSGLLGIGSFGAHGLALYGGPSPNPPSVYGQVL